MKKAFTNSTGKKHKIIGYMDAVDFFYEGGEPSDGNRFFANVEDLKKEDDHINSCGIVKVEVRFIEWKQRPTEPIAKRICPENGEQIEWKEICNNLIKDIKHGHS